MKLRYLKILVFAVSVCAIVAFSKNYFTSIYFETPKNWPKPVFDFSKNPLTEEGFQLGRNLFYDPILSRDNTISCSSCHLQQTGFTHVDHDLSHGIEGKIGTRNSLTLQNLAWTKDFMYDGGVNNLEVQPIHPITSEDEMDETLENVVAKLQKSEKYQELFQKAFGTNKITGQLTLKALSQFVVMLVTSNSKYDRVLRKEETFTAMEQNGYVIFQQNCTSCHIEPLLTSEKFENTGLPVDKTLNDIGRMRITLDPKDKYKFKVPTLRNIQFTFPYMHDGRFKTINDVVLFYNTNNDAQKILKEKNKKEMHLTDNERTDLVAFLKTLTDKEFLFNPKFSFPR